MVTKMNINFPKQKLLVATIVSVSSMISCSGISSNPADAINHEMAHQPPAANNLQPTIIYYAANGEALADAITKIANRSGITFKVNTDISHDLLKKTVTAEDWNSAVTQLLEGYNYASVKNGSKIESVTIIGRGQLGDTSQLPIAASKMITVTPKNELLTGKYRNFPAGSVMPIDLPIKEIMSVKDNSEITLDLPIGKFGVVHDRTAAEMDGSSTWVGDLKDDGAGYHVFLSEGAGGIMGHINTPNGTYTFESDGSNTYLVDSSKLINAGFEGDTISAPNEILNAAATTTNLTTLQQAVTTTQTAVTKAQTAYNTAMTNFTTYQATVSKNLTAYQTAQNAYTSAYNFYVNSVNAYNNTAVSYARSPTTTNKAALTKAQTAVTNAINAVNTAAKTANTAATTYNSSIATLQTKQNAVITAKAALDSATNTLKNAQAALAAAQTPPKTPTVSTTPSTLPPATTPSPSASSLTEIDIMVVYTTNKLTAAVANQRIAYLVTASNQAYIDSKINMRLRLVHTEGNAYTDQNANDTALADLAGNKGTLSTINATRTKYGADLVFLFRPLYTAAGNCGATYVEFAKGSSANPAIGYGTINDGHAIDDNRYNCDINTFTHEIGHTLGLVHEPVNSTFSGVFADSYAYGIAGKFGTIMSYISPVVMLFATPDLPTQCSSGPCGILNQSNQNKAVNYTAPIISKFMPTVTTTPVLN